MSLKLLFLRLIKIITLLILPVIFILICNNYKREFPDYSLNSVDPEMAYLYNGLTITHGHYAYFVDHPGIPLQYISAGVIAVVHPFREGTIDEDVIKNPDFYLNLITWTFIILNFVALFFLGFLSYKLFENLFAGLLIQLTPFVSIIYLHEASRTLPEFFSLIIAAVFVLTTMYYTRYSDDNDLARNDKYPVLFAIGTAFAISVKITFLFYLLIPVFILRSKREKIKFFIYLLPSIAFFLIPVWNRWGYFYRWMKSLIVHSGQYGAGSENVIDKSLFQTNLVSIYSEDRFFFYLIGILFIGIIIYFIPQFKLKRKNDLWFNSLLIFLIVSLLTILLIAKQLKLYYLSPACILAVPLLFFLLMIFQRNSFFKKGIFTVSFFILSACIFFFELYPVLTYCKSTSKDRYLTKMEIGEKYIKAPIANVSTYYGSAFYGYSAQHGLAYSNDRRRKEFFPSIVKILPHFYSYHHWNHLFNYWDKRSFTFSEILSQNDSVYLYSGDGEISKDILKEIFGLNTQIETSHEVIYTNDITKETFIKFKRKKDKVKNWSFIFTSEDSVGNIDDLLKNYRIDEGTSRSDTRAFSGRFCSRLDKGNPYGIGTVLTNLQKGDCYTFSVWKYKNENKESGLVISSVTPGKFYSFENKQVDEKNGWVKIQTIFKINDDLNRQSFKVYCWQSGDENPSYWDDFTIVKN